jgi:hypothetical protein
MGRIYRAYRAFREPLHRGVLPLSNNNKNVETNQTCRVIGRMQSDGFWPDRLTISNASTQGGAADWVVNDVRIAGKSQFLQSGDVPGDMFATEAVKSFVSFDVVIAGVDVELVVTYIGTNEKGCPFYGAITGMEYDPGLLDIVRESLSQALKSVSRGLSTRPH